MKELREIHRQGKKRLTLLENFLNHISLNANIVNGMAGFDPNILLCLPMEQATFCFTSLYQSVSLRGWLEGSPENDCRDEYLEFVGPFRKAYHTLKNSYHGNSDMVDLLSAMPELRNRIHFFEFSNKVVCALLRTHLCFLLFDTMISILRDQSVGWEMFFCQPSFI